MRKSSTYLLVGALPFTALVFIGGYSFGKSAISPKEYITELSQKDNISASLFEPASDESLTDFTPFWYVWNTLNTKYVSPSTSTPLTSPEQKMWAAINGLTASYEDPYTIFMPPKNTEQFKIQTNGQFEGVGMVVGLFPPETGVLTVIKTLEDSPARKAGLLPEDHIVKIDSAETKPFTVDESVSRIRGDKGTEVILTVIRKGEDEPLDISVIRGKVDLPSTERVVLSRTVTEPAPVVLATNNKPLPGGLTLSGPSSSIDTPAATTQPPKMIEVKKDFYAIRLSSFSKTTPKAFKKELELFEASDTNKLIIDLRGNPGGFLESSVEIASWFLPAGDVITTERHTNLGDEVKRYVSKGYTLSSGQEPDLVVLVDRYSASAAEILAGALQDHERAVIIGEKTFGKGSVQELVDIPGGASLKVTVARWYSPLGRSFSHNGIDPDIIVAADSAPTHTSDAIMDRAVDYLLDGENILGTP